MMMSPVTSNVEDQVASWANNKYGAQASPSGAPATTWGAATSPSSNAMQSPSTWANANSSTPAAAPPSAPASTWSSASSGIPRTASATSGGMVTPQQWAPTAASSPASSPASTPAPAPAPVPAPAPALSVPGANAKPVTLDPATLATRTINPATETVSGQVNTLMGENSPVLQQAQAAAMRSAAGRGMLNSAMAASGGTDAMIQQAASIGTTDANAYNAASNYNTAATNQALMTNTSNAQQLQQLQLQMQDSAAARAQSLSVAQLQDATSRYNAELSSNTSRYATDTNYQAQMNSQKTTLVNQIINNMDLSPDRKAAMLEALGEGTSANGSNPGTGLAGASYVIGSTSADLNPGIGSGSGQPQNMAPA